MVYFSPMLEKSRNQNSELTISVGRLLGNPALLDTLAAARSLIKEGGGPNDFRAVPNYPQLQAALTAIFWPSVMIARREFVRQHPLSSRREVEVADALDDLDSTVWSLIFSRFNWGSFDHNPEHASNALAKYLSQASHAVLSKTQKPAAFHSRTPSPAVRSLENDLVAREERQELAHVIKKWLSSLSPAVADTVRKHYMDGISTEQLAQETHLNTWAIRKRISDAREKLEEFLTAYGYESQLKEMTRSVTDLAQRRSHLQRVFHNFEKYLSPQTSSALVIYFGLDGKEPNYSFEKTAEEMQTSSSNVRHLVALGWGIVSRQMLLTARTVLNKGKMDLYDAWKAHPERYSFSPDDKRLLSLYFEEHQTTTAIGKLLGVSENAVQRRINRLLDIVDRAISTTSIGGGLYRQH